MKNVITRGVLLFVGAVLLAHCDSPSSVSPALVTSVGLSLADSTIEAGQTTSATATAFDQFGQPLAAAVTYSSSAPLIAAVNPSTGVIFAVSSGSVQISATVGAKTKLRTLTVLRAPIVLNEIKPDSSAPTGYVELYNATLNDLDISGWRLTASDVFQGFTIPLGTMLLAGHYKVIAEVNFPLGLNSADAVHLFSPAGILVETFRWLVDPAWSYGRCPDGFGSFASTTVITRGAGNICAEAGP